MGVASQSDRSSRRHDRWLKAIIALLGAPAYRYRDKPVRLGATICVSAWYSCMEQ